MLLCWSMLLLCLSANAENTVMYRESGESITLKCSYAGCLTSINNYDGMYLNRHSEEQETVLYYHPKPQSKDKITLGMGYHDRVETKGSLENHTITISKLTVNDSGRYTCVYKKFPKSEMRCNVYSVIVKAASKQCVIQQCPFPVLIMIASCAISMLVTMLVTLLIVLRVKHWSCSRRKRHAPQISNDYVYEIMTKNGFCPPAAPEQSLQSPYEIV